MVKPLFYSWYNVKIPQPQFTMPDDEHDRWANGQIKDKFNKRPKVTLHQEHQTISQPKELCFDKQIKLLNQKKFDCQRSLEKALIPKMQHVPRKGLVRLRVSSDIEARRVNQKELLEKIKKIEEKRAELIKQKSKGEDRDR